LTIPADIALRASSMDSSRASNSASEASSPEDVEMADAQPGATRGFPAKNGYFAAVSFYHDFAEARSARVSLVVIISDGL
jgi:hypothetical protein